MTTPTLHITRGLPASGKSTFAREWVAEATGRARVSRDHIRRSLFGDGYTPAPGSENLVSNIERHQVESALRVGRDVIVDAMHLRARHARDWAELARDRGVGFEVHDFPVDPAEAIRRDAARDRTVGATVIAELAKKFIGKGGALPPLPAPRPRPGDGEQVDAYVAAAGTPTAILVDVDGTVAHMGDRRGPFEWDKVSLDEPNAPVIDVVRAAHDRGHVVVFMSGRNDVCREDTLLWLRAHVGAWVDELHMRADGDGRPDFFVKRDLFDAHIRHRYDVQYALDDRDQVVKLWRSIGLTCLQVDYGNF